MSNQTIPSPLQSQFGHENVVNGDAEQQIQNGVGSPAPQADSRAQADIDERKARLEQELLGAARKSHSRGSVANYSAGYDKAVRDFDPSDRRVQAAEFYRFNDGHYRRWGYF